MKFKLNQRVICAYEPKTKRMVESGTIVSWHSSTTIEENDSIRYEVMSDYSDKFTSSFNEDQLESNKYNLYVAPYTPLSEYETLIKQRESIEAWK